MSFLGLKDDVAISQQQAQSVSASQSNPTDKPGVTNGYQNSSSSSMTYAGVARSKPTTQLSSQMRQAVVSAVYVDLHSKSARVNNIIVSGLPKLDRTDDKDTVLELIGNEFNIIPTIKHCRRLGKAADKPQNLLVTLESLDHVNVILSNAKQLRSSHNDLVRANVYINSDLTKAEAAVAYEERCRRRLQREERSSRQQLHQQKQQQDNKGKNSSASRVNDLSACSPTHTAVISSIGVIKTQLNASVAVFQPASVVRSTENQASTYRAPSISAPCM